MHEDVPDYFNDAYLKKDQIDFRLYQYNIIKKCKDKNSLVVLPTGLGKTIIAILAMANKLKKYSNAKILMLAPTRPLVSQHKESIEKFLDIDNEDIVLFTGRIKPEKRILAFGKAKIIISTPQVIKNDLIRGRYNLKKVALIIFDEAHRTRGNYAYNFISNEYIDSCVDPTILALTASPGKNLERIQELCDNLYIEEVIFKTRNDYDVKSYLFDTNIFIERVDLPLEFLEISEIWNNLFQKFLNFFIERNLINPFKKFFSKLDFLRLCHDLTISLKFDRTYDSKLFEEQIVPNLYHQDPILIDIVEKNNLNIQSIFSYCSSCISILHAKDLLETQELSLFKSFLDKLKNKADQDIVSAKRIFTSKHFSLINSLLKKEKYSIVYHSKIYKLISIIKDEIELFNNKKIIIFTQYRQMAEFLKRFLKKRIDHRVIIEKFIGQSTKYDDIGFRQKKQIEIINNFKKNKINILIATSVAEEGLDIPSVDAIIFYEPVPSEIRSIQRRGRTGRFSDGRCYIMMTNHTVDIPFYLASCRKEKQMSSVLNEKNQLELCDALKRDKIDFKTSSTPVSESKNVLNYHERKLKENEALINRSIEAIIEKIDSYSNSNEYNKIKSYGITFVSDLIQFDKSKLRKNIQNIKGRKKKQTHIQKRNLNKNLKTLIKIARYSENGKTNFLKFKALAREEEINDRKFYIHFNHACNLGYLKKENNQVYLIKDCS
jgi:Fanconi anemia group M protein